MATIRSIVWAESDAELLLLQFKLFLPNALVECQKKVRSLQKGDSTFPGISSSPSLSGYMKGSMYNASTDFHSTKVTAYPFINLVPWNLSTYC
ncbi:hypothetical protein PR048_029772 [Dryococelus australis]|uniref:Uncharacterized protein n=1 Tax=Dryococelus australis TaxID=614101 RepID=A0ABQ9G9Q8_9NEOP|nr:hypothetical protein PR048_029772 [Dryococelus australis]